MSVIGVIVNHLKRLVLILLDIFITLPIKYFATQKKSKKCPPITDDLLLISATELARKIRNHQLTSKEIITAYIQRIQEVNPTLNALVEPRYEDALLEAQRADDLITSNEHSSEELESKFPLLGVPVTVKASIAVKGLLYTSCRRFEDVESRRAKFDADVIKQLKQAGAVIVCHSSCPELCVNFECFNKIIGTTMNPYDTRRTCGGSSGGEAALLSSGASVIGVGSDIAGSLRLPAAFCGIFGHKGTEEAASIEGHYPDSSDRVKWNKVFTVGPMVRYAEDLRLLQRVLSKPDKLELLKLEEPVNLKQIKVYYAYEMGSYGTHDVDKEIIRAMNRVLKHFENISDVKPEKVVISNLSEMAEVTLFKFLDIQDVDDVFDKDPDRCVLKEVLKCLLGKSEHTISALSYILAKRAYDTFATSGLRESVRRKIEKMEASFKSVLRDEGVFIFPTHPNLAGFHGTVYSRLPDGCYTSIFNHTGLPSTSCHVELSRDGLPIGIQVVANTNGDRLTFAVAEEIQRVFGGWNTPPSASIVANTNGDCLTFAVAEDTKGVWRLESKAISEC